MPESKTSKSVKQSMIKQYGPKKGKQVFYATAKARKGGEGRTGEAEKASTWKKKDIKSDIQRSCTPVVERRSAMPTIMLGYGFKK